MYLVRLCFGSIKPRYNDEFSSEKLPFCIWAGSSETLLKGASDIFGWWKYNVNYTEGGYAIGHAEGLSMNINPQDVEEKIAQMFPSQQASYSCCNGLGIREPFQQGRDPVLSLVTILLALTPCSQPIVKSKISRNSWFAG